MQNALAEQRVEIQRQLADRASVQPQIRQQQRQLLASDDTQPNESLDLGMVNGRPSQSPEKPSWTQQSTLLNGSQTPTNPYAAQPSLVYKSPPILARSVHPGNQASGITQTSKSSVQPTPTLRTSYGSSLPSVTANPSQRGYSSYIVNPTYASSANGIVASNSPQTRVEEHPNSMVDGTRAVADTGRSGTASSTEKQDWTCPQCAGNNNGRLATWRCLKCGNARK